MALDRRRPRLKFRLMSGNILIAVMLLVVAGILAAGIYSLWRGGEFSKNWSNRLMRLRIVAQAAAIVVIMAMLYMSGR